MSLPLPPLLVITDRHQAKQPLETIVEAVFAADCRWISLREKDLDPAERLDLLRRLISLAAQHGALVSVHDDVEAARSLGIGLHLPAGASLHAGRQVLGRQALIGISTHSLAEVRGARVAGADYVTLSPIFESASKPGYGPALGLDALAEASKVGIPLLALGGITEANAKQCLAAGASGMAVMGPVMRAADPGAATAGLLSALSASPNEHR